jgi:hypothetical protein
MAEAVVDVLNTALGVTEDFGADGPAKCRAVEIGASRVQNQTLSYTFRPFGRPPRTSACDCERASQPALPQTLFLMTDQTLQTKLGTAKGGRLKTLIDSKKSDDDVLDELFLATLTRLPTDKERKSFTAYRAGEKDRAAAYTGTLWALINTREFILNH